MILSYWNALRVDDEVCVHDDSDPGFAISDGTVAFIDSSSDPNLVTVRIADAAGTTHAVRPKRLAVHLKDRDSRAGCWRCALLN